MKSAFLQSALRMEDDALVQQHLHEYSILWQLDSELLWQTKAKVMISHLKLHPFSPKSGFTVYKIVVPKRIPLTPTWES